MAFAFRLWNGVCSAAAVGGAAYLAVGLYTELLGAIALQMQRRDEALALHEKYCATTTHAQAGSGEFAKCSDARRLLSYGSLASETYQLFYANVCAMASKKLEWLAWVCVTRASLIAAIACMAYGATVAAATVRRAAAICAADRFLCDVESGKKLQ
jgi:hypothetical protein